MSNPRPNVLLITTDQQRGDCLGLDPDGPDCLQTPNLDWIGRTGTHFRRGYAECPSGFGFLVCCVFGDSKFLDRLKTHLRL